RSKLIEPDDPVNRIRSETRTDEILLRRKRTLRRIEREIFEEATEVVKDFGFALAKRIDRRAQARRPLTGKAVTAALAVDRRSIDPLLLLSQSDDRRDETIDSPGVLNVGGVIAAVGVEIGIAEFRATQLQRDAQRIAIGVQRDAAIGTPHNRA